MAEFPITMDDSIPQQAGPELTEIGTVVLSPKGRALNITRHIALDAADIAAGYRVVPAYVHLAAPLAVEDSRERCASSIRVAAEQARVALNANIIALDLLIWMDATPWQARQAAKLNLVDTKGALASLEAALAAQPEQQQGQGLVHPAMSTSGRTSVEGGDLSDAARLNWLERQTVEVRVAQRYGSRRAIYEIASWDEEQDEPAPSGLRAAIDAEMKEQK